jgi:magnesium-transporting ATPase (P-type)
VVVTTGDNTEIGTINALVNKVEKKKTNVQLQIDTIAKWLAFMILIAAFITWMVAHYVALESWLDALSTALVCAVAMVPEGLMAIVTMVRTVLVHVSSRLGLSLAHAFSSVGVDVCMGR